MNELIREDDEGSRIGTLEIENELALETVPRNKQWMGTDCLKRAKAKESGKSGKGRMGGICVD
ncbi:unnamed protein product [Fusarium graminearum]|uniref:Chromosome 2, complete genome n=1 Tax=Gibberella zeae (strain ATCC MYA-4620 / CBS 123657 / FGSC 9075 / NRRL 31084 / PH-1) TaxID=229533 RepID=A0A098DEH2_GIBZE|nr:unnamed protein product [Fusarium graminearum]CZS80665.1 unnamed protein product [Fusarium graminearum]